jgi:cytochrome c oxidase assembly protein subunit 15
MTDLRPVRAWLLTLYGLVLTMVLLGGITRLTGSGLSMVEWQPLMGALPPLNHAQWTEVFARYQQTPQYKLVNDWMTLGDFQRIFFWEYVHRLVGRLVGVAFLVPWVWFLVRRQLTGRWARLTGVAFLLGGLQGALGWFMVKSGLVDVPAVSHFRLAAHLTLAFFVAQYLFWLALETRPTPAPAASAGLRRAAWGFVALVMVQIVYGAFMAGTHAGWLYSTFPTMNGEWVPADMGSPLYDPMAIHFLHRALGTAVALAALALWGAARKRGARAVSLLPWAVGLQFGLGVLTVVLHVPIAIAVIHQAGALGLLTVAVATAHSLRGVRAEAAEVAVLHAEHA